MKEEAPPPRPLPLTEKTTSDGVPAKVTRPGPEPAFSPGWWDLWRLRSSPLCSAPLPSGSWHSNWDPTVGQPSWAPGPLFTGLSQPFPVLWRPLCSQVPDNCSPRAGLRANQISPGPPSPPRTCCPSTWQLRQKAASEIYLMKDTVFFVEQTMKS